LHVLTYRYPENFLWKNVAVVADHSKEARIPPIPSNKSTPSNVRELQGTLRVTVTLPSAYNLHASDTRTAGTDIDSRSTRTTCLTFTALLEFGYGRNGFGEGSLWVIAGLRILSFFDLVCPRETKLEGLAQVNPSRD
jgi:hypothetical protein